jgi:predicted nucleic acid-binding protein
VDGYLLDANALFSLLKPNDPKRQVILAHIRAVPAEAPIFVATSTLAEAEVGCCLGDRARSEAQAEIRETIRANGFGVIDFTRHTAAEYGALKAALMYKYNRAGVKKNAAKWPEAWPNPATGRSLDIDEFDLLVVAHALERRLVLVTNDEMHRIRDGLGEAASELRLEDWSVLTTPTE